MRRAGGNRVAAHCGGAGRLYLLPVIKAHGSSDARAIYNAIRQAIAFADSGIIDDITANISYMRVDKHAAKECD